MNFLQNSNSSRRSLLFSMAVFLFPLGAGVIKSWASAFFFFLLLLSLVVYRKEPQIEFLKAEKILFLIVLSFYLPLFISLLNSVELLHGIHRVERVDYYVLSSVAFLTLRRMGLVTVRYLCLGTILAGPVMLGVALWDIYFKGMSRASGFYNPIFLGQISILMAALGLAGLFLGRFPKGMNILLLLSVVCSFSASLMSGSRGPLLALPLLILIFLFVTINKENLRRSIPLIILLALTSALCLPFLSTTVVADRFLSMFAPSDGLVSYVEISEADVRFQIWEDALVMWRKNPIIGTGFGDFETDQREMMASGKAKSPTLFSHAHSIYFEFLATTGLLGLFSLIFTLFLGPAYIFFKSLRYGAQAEHLPALVGLLSVVCFAVFGLTSAWTARSAANAIYALCLLVSLSSIFNLRSRPYLSRAGD